MSDKNELLDELHIVLNPEKKLDIYYLVYILLILVFVWIVLFPKIYIQQQIYFTSRDIAKLQNEYDILKEENKIIHASVEEIKFKNQILDTMF